MTADAWGMDTRESRRVPAIPLTILQYLMLSGSIAFALVTSGLAHWDMAPLAAIAIYAVTSELLSVKTTVSKVWISGSSVAVVLTTVLYGGPPAA